MSDLDQAYALTHKQLALPLMQLHTNALANAYLNARPAHSRDVCCKTQGLLAAARLGGGVPGNKDAAGGP